MWPHALLTACCLHAAVSVTIRAKANPAPEQGGGQQPLSGVSAKSTRNIKAVIDTLNDILISAANEERESSANFNSSMAWCGTTTSNLTADLSSSKEAGVQSDVTLKEMRADLYQTRDLLASLGREIQEASEMLEQAKELRQEESDKYDQDADTNTQSRAQVQKAIEILGKVQGAGGFLQKGSLQKLQLNEPGESSYVLGVMKQLSERLNETKQELDAAEQASTQQFANFSGTKSRQITDLRSEKAETTTRLRGIGLNLVDETRRRRLLKEKVEALTAQLAETEKKCEEDKHWFEIRSADRAKEMLALRQAIDYLKGSLETPEEQDDSPASLLQLASTSGNAIDAAAVGAMGNALLGATGLDLRGMLAGKDKQAALESIKVVVANLISHLQKEQSDEEQMQKYCTGELSKKEAEKGKASEERDRLSAAAEFKASTVEALTSELQAIDDALKAMKENLEKAALIRQNEKLTYKAGAKDRELAVKVLRQAKQVLQEFYSTEDKTQGTRKTLAGTGGADLDHENGVIAMLQKIEDDIVEEHNAAAAEEKDAEASFEKLQSESVEEFDKQMQEITERKQKKARTLVQLGSVREEHVEAVRSIASIEEQLGDLHGQCDQLLRNFDKRTEKRSFEVSQLRDIVDILSGSSLAVRTG
mmetsp:Transcript_60993/g.132265  ORF Transcript_60993/g.132265 Transcript_60993/m.132265 type:complete len:650 (-) Transcript_60993:77-2026(-)